jgi:hypothetical protein
VFLPSLHVTGLTPPRFIAPGGTCLPYR